MATVESSSLAPRARGAQARTEFGRWKAGRAGRFRLRAWPRPRRDRSNGSGFTASGGGTSSSRSTRSSATARPGGGARTSSRRPGSGKTLLGMEIVRRLGAPALVLVPNSAVQAQWLRAARRVRRRGRASPRPTRRRRSRASPTRRSCRLDDPAAALGDLAERRWAAERADATGQTVEEVEREAAAWTGEAATRRRARARADHAPRSSARSRAPSTADLELGDLLAPGARERLDTLRRERRRHDRARRVPPPRLAVGLRRARRGRGARRRPPRRPHRDAARRADARGGRAVRRAARPGRLHRADAGRRPRAVPRAVPGARVADAAAAIRERVAGRARLALPGARHGAARRRRRARHEPARVGDRAHARARARGRRGRGGLVGVVPAPPPGPRPSRARGSSPRPGSTLPPGVPRGEGYREQPNLDDWLVLLEDYALRCLAADPSPRRRRGTRRSRAALRSLGFTLTRRGIRRGASDVDRLLTGSAAKPIALVEVRRLRVRGARRRAARARARRRRAARRPRPTRRSRASCAPRPGPRPRPCARWPPTRARRRCARCSSRAAGCAAPTADADALLAALRAHAAARARRAGAPSPATTGSSRCSAAGPAWQPRLWVDARDADLHGRRDAGARRHAGAARRGLGRAVRELPRRPERRDDLGLGHARCAAARCGSTRPTRTRSRRTGTSSASRPSWPAARPTTSGSSASTSTCSRRPRTARSRPGRRTSTPRSARSRRRRTTGSPRSTGRWRAAPPSTTRRASAGGSASRTRRGARDARRPAACAPRGGRRATRSAAGLPARAARAVRGRAARAASAPDPRRGSPAIRRALVGARRASRLRSGGRRAGSDACGASWPTRCRSTSRRMRCATRTRELGELDGRGGRRRSRSSRGRPATCAASCATRRPRRAPASSRALDSAVSAVESPRYLVSRLVPAAASGPRSRCWPALARRPPFERRWSAVPDDLGRKKERAEAFAAAWRALARPERAAVHPAQCRGPRRARGRGRAGRGLRDERAPSLGLTTAFRRGAGGHQREVRHSCLLPGAGLPTDPPRPLRRAPFG